MSGNRWRMTRFGYVSPSYARVAASLGLMPLDVSTI
jgi:hypothetical protein